MNTYAAYRVTVTNTEFQVKVTGRHTSHPMNWSVFTEGHSLEGVKQQAATQVLPVVFIEQDGTRHEHGVQFSSEAFERAMYRGYVAYGRSMTDGYYAPMDFETWVKIFRSDPAGERRSGNDFYPAEGAMEAYLR